MCTFHRHLQKCSAARTICIYVTFSNITRLSNGKEYFNVLQSILPEQLVALAVFDCGLKTESRFKTESNIFSVFIQRYNVYFSHLALHSEVPECNKLNKTKPSPCFPFHFKLRGSICWKI